MEKNKIILLLFLIIGFIFYISDKPIIRGGSMVGRIRVNGTANKIVKNNLKKVMKDSKFYVINLPKGTSDYVVNTFNLKANNDNKMAILYDEAFDGNINCPYARVFQKALQEAKNNEDNQKYFNFYSKPQITYIIVDDSTDSLLDFYNTCGLFCIFNPKTNHMISFIGVGNDEASKLQDLLNHLKFYNW